MNFEMERIALIDADIIRYQVGYASEGEDVEQCLKGVDETVASIVRGAEADQQRLFLTGKGNFRYDVATILPYKGNRSSSSKPEHYGVITEHLINKFGAEVIDGMEADDMLGIVQFQHDDPETETIICTIDKDLDMIPGWHYNWRKNLIYMVTDVQGDYAFYRQLLTGDRVDNIQGIPGIGPKKADKLLEGRETVGEMFDVVVDAYSDYYEDLMPSEVMRVIQENADLLWILRDYNNRWEMPI